MRPATRRAVITLLGGGVVAVLIGPLVFVLVGLGCGMGVASTLAAMLEQSGARRQNVLVPGALSLAPLLAFGLPIIWLAARRGSDRAPILVAASSAAVVIVMALTHWSFWPTFLPEKQYAGWPHGLEFVLGPLFYAPVASLVSVALAWLFMRSAGGKAGA